MSNDIEIIPACPPVGGYNSKAYREAVAANTQTNVRDQQVTKVVIPPAPVSERVEVPKVQRRNFGPAPAAYTSTSRRRD